MAACRFRKLESGHCRLRAEFALTRPKASGLRFPTTTKPHRKRASARDAAKSAELANAWLSWEDSNSRMRSQNWSFEFSATSPRKVAKNAPSDIQAENAPTTRAFWLLEIADFACGSSNLTWSSAKTIGFKGMRGWGGRIRTSAWRNQNPLPYRLATPQRAGGPAGADHKAAALASQPSPLRSAVRWRGGSEGRLFRTVQARWPAAPASRQPAIACPGRAG